MMNINVTLLAGEPQDNTVGEIHLRNYLRDATACPARMKVWHQESQALSAIETEQSRGLIVLRIQDEVCGLHVAERQN